MDDTTIHAGAIGAAMIGWYGASMLTVIVTPEEAHLGLRKCWRIVKQGLIAYEDFDSSCGGSSEVRRHFVRETDFVWIVTMMLCVAAQLCRVRNLARTDTGFAYRRTSPDNRSGPCMMRPVAGRVDTKMTAFCFEARSEVLTSDEHARKNQGIHKR